MMQTWPEIVQLAHRPPFVVRVRAAEVPHPLDSGMKLGIDLPLGQAATYSLPLSGGATLLVRDHGRHYVARLLRPPPRPLAATEAALRDAPGASVVAAAAAGALVGAAVGQSKESLLVGALIGGVVGLVGVGVANADASPRTSEAARASIDALLRAADLGRAHTARRAPETAEPTARMRRIPSGAPDARQGRLTRREKDRHE